MIIEKETKSRVDRASVISEEIVIRIKNPEELMALRMATDIMSEICNEIIREKTDTSLKLSSGSVLNSKEVTVVRNICEAIFRAI